MPETRGAVELLTNLWNELVPKTKGELAMAVAGGPLWGKMSPVVGGALRAAKVPMLADAVLAPILPRLEGAVSKIWRIGGEARSVQRALTDQESRRVAREFVDQLENTVVNATRDPTRQLSLNAESLGIPSESMKDVMRHVKEFRANRQTNLNAVNRMNPSMVDESGNLLERLPAGSTSAGGRGGPGSPTPAADRLAARQAARRAKVAAERARRLRP